MAFVVDASPAAAWLLPEEYSDAAEAVIATITAPCPVPSLFFFEIRNILAMAERRGRIGAGGALLGMERTRRLPLDDAGIGGDGSVLLLAASHALSAYEAAYLALAVSRWRRSTASSPLPPVATACPSLARLRMATDRPARDAVDCRAGALDTIAAVLPIDRRDELAKLLTDQDIETLRHLVNEGMGPNTLRALTSDLAYLQAWSLAATGAPLPWPAPEALLLKFVAHHLWYPQRRASDPQHGMPAEVDDTLRRQGFLKSAGPHAPDTVRRRLASWSTLTQWRGLAGAFASPALKSAIRLAVRAVPRTPRRKSARAVTADVLAQLLATCTSDSLRDVRDRAMLMVGFASGGRRRSEIAGLRVEQLPAEDPVAAADGTPLPSLAIHLGRTKTSGADLEEVVYLTGRPVEALHAWLQAARIETGSVFRRIDRWGNLSTRALDPKSVNDIVKQRAALAGLEPGEYSAHGLRSGYLTEAANRGIPLPEAMEQSRHRSLQQASSYYNNATRRSGKAARML